LAGPDYPELEIHMPKRESYFDFLDRCLKDIRTGKLYPAKRDREQINKNLERAGLAGKQSFGSSEELLGDYFGGMDVIEKFMVIEHVRVLQGGLPDPLEDLASWTDLTLREYLVIRIIVKLNALGVEKNEYAQWVGSQIGKRFLNSSGTIAFADEELTLELDRMLDKKLRREKHVGTNPSIDSE